MDKSAARDRPERIFADDELEQRRRDMLSSSDVRTCLSCGQRSVVADGGGFKCRSCGAEEPSAACPNCGAPVIEGRCSSVTCQNHNGPSAARSSRE